MSQTNEFEIQRNINDKYWDAMNDKSWNRCSELGVYRDEKILESKQYKNWLKTEKDIEKMKSENEQKYQDLRKKNKTW